MPGMAGIQRSQKAYKKWETKEYQRSAMIEKFLRCPIFIVLSIFIFCSAMKRPELQSDESSNKTGQAIIRYRSIVTEICRQILDQFISGTDQRVVDIISPRHVSNFNGSYVTLSGSITAFGPVCRPDKTGVIQLGGDGRG